MIQKWVEIALWKRTLVALILGWLFGYLLPNYVTYVEPLGKVFLNGIKMVVIPLIFSTLISSITGIGSYKELKAIGGTTIFWFLMTAIIATALGLTIAFLLDIGKGANFTQENWKGWKVPPFSENWVNLIPKNPIDAAAKSQVLPIVIFGLLLSISAVKAGDKAKSFNSFFVSLSETLFELVRFLMQISPIGVFAIIAGITKKYGWEGISVLFDVLIAIYLAAIIHIGVVYSGLLKFVAKVNPIKYFKNIFPAQILAFSTTSSYGTLPVTLEVTQKAGVSKRVSSFVTPLGATINMDGCGAFYPAISAVFIANLYNIELGFSQYAIIVLTATLSSLGTAGVPWASATALMMVLPSVGLPIEPVALLMSIDRVLDMARTTVNVTGDTVVSAIVARKVNEFDDSLYKTT